jgi:hypothetical protein
MRKFKILELGTNLFLLICGTLLPLSSMASDTNDAGIIAADVFSGIMTIKEIAVNACIIVGAFLILSSFFQYKKYRRNPSEMPIGRPITTLIVGIIIIAVTFIPIQLDILN